MNTICIKCREEKNDKQFSVFKAVISKTKRENRVRKTCYDCIYKNRIYRTFTWKNATDKQILERLRTRFNKYVIKASGCWGWKGFIRPDGYARMKCFNRTTNLGAHVISWMIHKKIVKRDDLYILHKCDNRTCTNPKHLYRGTHQQNMIDMAQRKGSTNTKLSLQQVKTIKKRLINGHRIVDIAKQYNVNQTTIGDIKHNRTWKHVKI